MTLGTILYILLFFVSVFISIMYLEFGAMALMGLMVTIPVCMFLFLLGSIFHYLCIGQLLYMLLTVLFHHTVYDL